MLPFILAPRPYSTLSGNSIILFHQWLLEMYWDGNYRLRLWDTVSGSKTTSSQKDKWFKNRRFATMEQKVMENIQKVKVRGKKNWNCSTKQKRSKAVSGQEARGRIAQEWYENDGKQNDLLSKTHQTLVTYTENAKGEAREKLASKIYKK